MRGKKSIKKHKENKEKIKGEERKIKPISSLSNSCKPPQIVVVLLLALPTAQLLPCTLFYNLNCCRQTNNHHTFFSQRNTNQHLLSSTHYLFLKLNILVSIFSLFIFIFNIVQIKKIHSIFFVSFIYLWDVFIVFFFIYGMFRIRLIIFTSL